MDEALALGTMIVVMQAGEIAQRGTPAEILARPQNDLVRDFVGGADAMMKLLEFRLVGELVRPGGETGEAVPASMTLRSALTRMIASGRTALSVVDENGAVVGAIHVADIVAASKR